MNALIDPNQALIDEMLASRGMVKMTVDDWLNQVDYASLNSGHYLPGTFALKFMNFIKLVNGEEGEQNLTPVVHLAMLDQIEGQKQRIANLCFRGAAKALALDTLILTPTGYVEMRDIRPGDTVYDRNGKATEVLYESGVFEKPTYTVCLVDGSSFVASDDHIHIIQWRSTRRVKGGKTETFWKEGEFTTNELLRKGLVHKRKVDERNPSGSEMKYFIPHVNAPVDFPERPVLMDPYTVGLILGDGSISPSNGMVKIFSHTDDVDEVRSYIPYDLCELKYDKRNPKTCSFAISGIAKATMTLIGASTCYNKQIPDAYLYNSVRVRTDILRGLMDTDGTMSPDGYASFCSVSRGLAEGVRQLVKSLGGTAKISNHKNGYAGYYRVSICLPEICPFRLQRKAAPWIQGRSINSGNRTGILSIEPTAKVIQTKCIAVASPTHSYLIDDCVVTHNTTLFFEYLALYLMVFGEIDGFGQVPGMIYVSDSMDNGVKSARQNIEFRYNNSEFLQEWIPQIKFTDSSIFSTSKDGVQLGIKMYGAMTGLRGTKIFGKRPVLAVLDDLVSDDNAKSKASMETIRATVYKGIDYALHPTKRKIVFNGTPFNKGDILYEAVESGGWHVNVWPVCEKFPCTKAEFRGAWEDRFTYDFVVEQYAMAVRTGELASFMQEMMLRITSNEERLIQDSEIKWYDRANLLKNKHRFNFYFTTDFATKGKEHNDYSVISVWAYSANGQWFWVDGICVKQTMDINIKELFRLVQIYKPVSVAVEISGQQYAFINWIRNEMMDRNTWFNFTLGKNGQEGIQPEGDKMARFNLVVPQFKAGNIFFPAEMRESLIMAEFINEISSATLKGLKSKHDDCIDTISLLMYLNPWKPSEEAPVSQKSDGVFDIDLEDTDGSSPITSYIV